MDNQMDSTALARYIESTDSISKPWLLVQLRLRKLQENRDQMSSEEYQATLDSIYRDSVNLGEWWIGIEDEVFGE